MWSSRKKSGTHQKARLHFCVVLFFVVVIFFIYSSENAAQYNDWNIEPLNTETSGLEEHTFNQEASSEWPSVIPDYYRDTILVLLKMDLWNERDIQDASHVLMLPMYCAFYAGWEEAIAAYDSFFERFVRTADSSFQELSRLQQMQFLYLGSQYMKLCWNMGRPINQALFDIVLENAREDLLGTPTWKTEATVRDHLMQVLAHKKYKREWYSCILDNDFYTLACLCDLKVLSIAQGLESTEEMAFAADYARMLLMDSEINTETAEGFWLFQVGVMKDYKDYAYAGNEYAYEGMSVAIKDDMVSDTSHFRRMPLWLLSYKDAQDDASGKEICSRRIEQLGKLFAERVLRKSKGFWVTSTFIDGSNGVFRYNYHDDGNAIEGYDQSGGTLFLGYWIMLGNESITAAYQEIANSFPLPADVSNPYYDNGITVREQNPIMDCDAVWDNGLMETLITCICLLSEFVA